MILFAHANGFPATTYNYFFQQMPDYDIRFIECLGLGGFPSYQNWRLLADELISFIETEKLGKVIGLGHSLGAVATLFASHKRPDLFQQIILLDPPFFHPSRSGLILSFRQLGLSNRIPIVKRARNRREFFANLEEARTYFTPKKLFSSFHPQAFEDYLTYGLMPHPQDDGLKLRIPAQIEADYFAHTPFIYKKKRLPFPSYLFHSTSGEVLRPIDLSWIQRTLPNTQLQAVKGGHMFPFEFPEETAEAVLRCLEMR